MSRVTAEASKPPRASTLRSAEPVVPIVLALAWAGAAAMAADAPRKPKLPPGVDPGGLAMAVIGDGIDYTRPEIATRLARDGEGELVGFDLVDRDRLPFAPLPGDVCPGDALLDLDGATPMLRRPEPRVPAQSGNGGRDASGTVASGPAPGVTAPSDPVVPAEAAPMGSASAATAGGVVGGRAASGSAVTCQLKPPALALAGGRGLARQLRIAVFRVVAGEPRQTAEALAMVARSPARIAVLQHAVPPDLLRQAAERVPELLILAPHSEQGVHPADICALANVVALGCHPADSGWNSEGQALVAAHVAQRTKPWSASAIKQWFAGPRSIRN